MPRFADPIRLPTGHMLPNRLMLSPLTTQQSHDDGRVADEDLRWLEMRAAGGFGMLLTAAAAVSRTGQAFPGQYGLYSARFLPGLSRLSAAAKRFGGVAIVQLQHGGGRSLGLDGNMPVAPSAGGRARTLQHSEIDAVVQEFGDAAELSINAGFDGVQVHAAYGFLLAQFFDPDANRRTDEYGGSLENRARLLRQVLETIRLRTPTAFLSVRLNASDRRLRPTEMLALTGELLEDGSVDHVDLVLEQHSDPRGIPGKPLSWVRGIKRNTGLLGLTGGFAFGSDIQRGFDEGADLIGIGTAAILHPDFPKQLLGNSQFAAGTLPVSPEYLRHQGVTAPFLDYLRKLPRFVKPDSIAA